MAYPWPAEFDVNAISRENLAEGFADRGLDLTRWFQNRKERRKCNSGLEEEIYLLRRYVFTLVEEGLFDFPVAIRKVEPPSPDFVFDNVGMKAGLEITEATSSQDQREMTKMEDNSRHQFIGAHGGRFSGGARGDSPERLFTADFARAIRRKARIDSKFRLSRGYPVDLLIYGNSNATRLIFEEERAIRMVDQFVQSSWQNLTRGSALRRISLILGEKLIIDVGQNSKIFNLRDSLDKH